MSTLPGLDENTVAPADLQNAFARRLAALLDGDEPFCELIECRQGLETSTIIADLSIEVPQNKAYPIKPIERVAFIFSGSVDPIPLVFALREDFPVVQHLNMHICEIPRMLCLYEESKSELLLRMTPSLLIRDTRMWMALNAIGELHQDNQPVEPFLIDTSGYVIMPSDWRQNAVKDLTLLSASKIRDDKIVLRLCFANDPSSAQDEEPNFSLLSYQTQPTVHGHIRRMPTSLSDLQDILASIGFDIVEQLRKDILHLKDTSPKKRLLVLVTVPIKRDQDGPAETYHTWGFLPGNRSKQEAINCTEIAELLGVTEGGVRLLSSGYSDEKIETIALDTVRVVDGADRTMLATYNMTRNADVHVAAIGCGALGSQVVAQAARMGFGEWLLVDHDLLLPHNLARHALTYAYVGYHKATALAHHASLQSDKNDGFTDLIDDVTNPEDPVKFAALLADVDLVLDMSASVSVSRFLSLAEIPRVASFFLSPSGSDLVLLAENKDRSLRLTSLEAQYYRAIVRNNALRSHMRQPTDSVRYSRSCGDISSRIPQWKIGALSGIAMGSLENLPSSPDARICIWSLHKNGSINRIEPPTSTCTVLDVGSWTVHLDQGILNHICLMRSDKLPRETGGILLGNIDYGNGTILLVDALNAPEDSEEWPNHFIRGKSSLLERASVISERTAGNVTYLGEWHSHPDGCRSSASSDDCQLLDFLTNKMSQDGAPGVMLIIARNSCSIYIQDGPGAKSNYAYTSMEIA